MASAGGDKPRESKKRKKVKKDKWGQPLNPASEKDGDQPQAPCDGGLEKQAEELPSTFEPNKVVVSGMPYSTTEEEIRGLFEDVGEISSLQISTFPDSGNFRGLAFVTLQNEETVTKSLELDGFKMGNRFIKVERCRVDSQKKRKTECLEEPKKTDGCYSAYIGNLSWNVKEDDIRGFFGSSKIASIRFAINKRTGEFRGFGHIDFEDDTSLEEAIRKNQIELLGRPVKVAYAVTNRG